MSDGAIVAKGMIHEKVPILNENQIVKEMEGNKMLVDI